MAIQHTITSFIVIGFVATAQAVLIDDFFEPNRGYINITSEVYPNVTSDANPTRTLSSPGGYSLDDSSALLLNNSSTNQIDIFYNDFGNVTNGTFNLYQEDITGNPSNAYSFDFASFDAPVFGVADVTVGAIGGNSLTDSLMTELNNFVTNNPDGGVFVFDYPSSYIGGPIDESSLGFLTLQLQTTSGAYALNSFSIIDNSPPPAVPEPATMVMMAAATGGIVLCARRRRR